MNLKNTNNINESIRKLLNFFFNEDLELIKGSKFIVNLKDSYNFFNNIEISKYQLLNNNINIIDENFKFLEELLKNHICFLVKIVVQTEDGKFYKDANMLSVFTTKFLYEDQYNVLRTSELISDTLIIPKNNFDFSMSGDLFTNINEMNKVQETVQKFNFKQYISPKSNMILDIGDNFKSISMIDSKKIAINIFLKNNFSKLETYTFDKNKILEYILNYDFVSLENYFGYFYDDLLIRIIGFHELITLFC